MYSRHISRHHMVETSAAVLIRKQFKGNPSTAPLACRRCFHLCEWLPGSLMKTLTRQTHEAGECSNKLSLKNLKSSLLSAKKMTLASLLASWSGLVFYFQETSAIILGKDKLRYEKNDTYIKKLMKKVDFYWGRSEIIFPRWQISITCIKKIHYQH